MSVNAISPVSAPILAPASVDGISTSPAGGGFGQVLADALNNVEAAQKTAHASADSFMRGETEEIHKVALDQQRAAIAFDFFLQVRNKVVSAYQEIMKMQV
ncbi:MAG: flagellar hook-basal body complex protein FliE [Bryobacteraceae bacterium]